MFEKRLKWFSIILGLVGAFIILRLVDLQILHAGEYEGLAARMMTRPVRYMRAVRGSIFDRNGRLLAGDVSAFDISVHFGVVAGRDSYLTKTARDLRELGDFPPDMSTADVVSELRLRIAHMWQRLAELTGCPISELIDRKEQIRERVERIAANVPRRPAKEETWFHPLMENIDDRLALAIRVEFSGMPWIRITPGSRRITHEADDFAHLLGRMGAVSGEAIEDDPCSGDELRGLRAGEACGTSGVERLADSVLRGTRGKAVEDFDGSITEYTEQKPGRNVWLSVDSELQRKTLEILRQSVSESRAPAGAAAVVIDVRTREVLVLASYPTYRVDSFNADYGELRRDTKTSPLLFRAVAAQYPPGSICKAICLTAGLTEGVINANTTVECRGHMGRNDAFRCWIYNQYGLTHGPQTPEEAVKNSCNIFFYTLGERLGTERLCAWFTRFGMGAVQGTGLIEEQRAIVPDTAWLMNARGRASQKADAWNFAIGQGEITVTPIQAANVCATIASGKWAPVKLVHAVEGDNSGDETRAIFHGKGLFPSDEPLSEEALRILRKGMYRVVNDSDGTGHKARLDAPDYVLCGKTGSAQASPFVVSRRWWFEWPDGQRESVDAATREDAMATFAGEKPRYVNSEILERYPALLPGEKLPAHGWFIGFTQPASTKRGATPSGAAYAIAVIIEFAGSGGQMAGPAAKAIAETVLAYESAKHEHETHSLPQIAGED